ncbi:MAG: hypothetical protein AAFU78_11090, partial [Cyanobacteria bacterium J06633_2]
MQTKSYQQSRHNWAQTVRRGGAIALLGALVACQAEPPQPDGATGDDTAEPTAVDPTGEGLKIGTVLPITGDL